MHISGKYPALYACLKAIGKTAYHKRVPLETSILKSREPVPFAELRQEDFRPARNPEPWAENLPACGFALKGSCRRISESRAF